MVHRLRDGFGLQKKNVVTAVAGARLLDECIDQGRVKSGEEGNAGKDALLQIALGKKILTERIGRSAQALVALQLE
ncbi:MAG: hypothetical protein WAU43_08700, partial [Acidobacteriaceae bacterium]